MNSLIKCRQTLVFLIGLFFLVSCLEPVHNSTGSASSSQPVYNTEIDMAAQKIFSDSCNSCHGSASPGYGGISYIDDIASMILNGIVVPGNPSASLVHTEIDSGSMPISGSLSSDDRQTISDWIVSLENRSPSNGDGEDAPTYNEIYSSRLKVRAATTLYKRSTSFLII